MKKVIMAIVITQMLFSCCTSSKKATDVVAVATEEQTVAADTVVTADILVQMDALVEEMDTIVEQEENPKVPVTFIDSITFQYDSLLGDCQQLFVVYNFQASSIVSELKVLERNDDGWVVVDSLCGPCNVGRKGFAAFGKKVEGDKKTPTGIYTITQYFSKFPEFEANLEKIKVTSKTIWVDDPKDKMYNKYCEQNDASPKQGERLIRKDGQYDYVMVINYNTETPIRGKGSAIFFHVWTRLGGGTAGCVAVEKQHILKIFKWIDAAKHPMILMGSRENDGIFSIEQAMK